jgi:hypothetical protein
MFLFLIPLNVFISGPILGLIWCFWKRQQQITLGTLFCFIKQERERNARFCSLLTLVVLFCSLQGRNANTAHFYFLLGTQKAKKRTQNFFREYLSLNCKSVQNCTGISSRITPEPKGLSKESRYRGLRYWRQVVISDLDRTAITHPTSWCEEAR